MAAQKKQKKKAGQLHEKIKAALSAFAAGIESKINKHNADIAALIAKLTAPVFVFNFINFYGIALKK